MNQKGEAGLFAVTSVVVLVSVMLLCTLELRRSFNLLQKRTELFLCTKELKGELGKHIQFMHKTNWGLRNIQRAQIVMIFIPGLQGAALNVGKLRKVIKGAQIFMLISYLKQLNTLRTRGCPIDPRMLITPYRLKGLDFERDSEGAAKLREKKWTYLFLKLPYALELEVTVRNQESFSAKPKFLVQERAGKLSSLLSSQSL